MNNTELIQTYFDNILKEVYDAYPNYSFSQAEAIILRSMHGQLSSFRHRANNPDQYTGQKYDPSGTLKQSVNEENIIEIEDHKHATFFSSKIPLC